MVALIFSYIFLALASICNSIMDVTSHHFHQSVFKRTKDPIWWNSEISWANKYIARNPTLGRVKWKILGFKFNKPVQITDAWHFFKMWMIIFICAAISCGVFFEYESIKWWWVLIYFSTLGVTWNSVFSLFYDKIWKKI